METAPHLDSIPWEFYSESLIYSGECNSGTAVVMIPGNPGVVSFYIPFLDKMFDRIGAKCDVYCISHANHGKHSTTESDCDDVEIFSLGDQLEHKLWFCNLLVHGSSHVKPTSSFMCPFRTYGRLILIGHSIGCYLAQEVSKRLSNVDRVINLMPTVHGISDSPQGIALQTRVLPFDFLIRIVVKLYEFLPSCVQSEIIRVAEKTQGGKIREEGNEHERPFRLRAIEESFTYRTYRNITTMALCELLEVDELDEEFLSKNRDKMYYFFSGVDGWCPPELQEPIVKVAHPSHVHVDESGVPHAFVLTHNEFVSERIARWIEE